MRRRAKRDLVVLSGIVLVIGAIAAVNFMFVNQWDYDEWDAKRRVAEAQRESQGLDLLDWDEIRKTEGSLSRGGQFTDALKAYDGQQVDVMGFMTPLNEFRNVREFILLPVPIECYFCRIPPARDVVIVQMAEGNEVPAIYKEPVLLNGTLTLHDAEKSDYFYSITNAKLGAGEYTVKHIPEEHMTPQHQQTEDLVPPMDVPVSPAN